MSLVSNIKKVFLLINSERVNNSFAETVRKYLNTKNISFLESDLISDKLPTADDLQDIDLAVSLGGDGTLLTCARVLAGTSIPILPVNLGTVGFITEVTSDEWQTSFVSYAKGELGLSIRMMLKAEVIRDGKSVLEVHGLNDAVIAAEGRSKIIRLLIKLSNTSVASYNADGMILATPTGSTAYSLAAGGPIVHPEMEAFIITPICPFTLSNRPIVIPAAELVEVIIPDEQNKGINLMVDGIIVSKLQPRDSILFTRSSNETVIIRSNERNFYQILNSKLDWAGKPHA